MLRTIKVDQNSKYDFNRSKVIKIYRKKKKSRSINPQPLKKFEEIVKETQNNLKSLKVVKTKEEKESKIKDLSKTISHSLLALDTYLQTNGVLKEQELNCFLLSEITLQKDGKHKKLRKIYQEFLTRFMEIGEVPENVIYSAWVLNKRAVMSLKKKSSSQFEKGENLLLFSASLYLSIKFLIDKEKWFIEDFSFVSGFEPNIIEEMEMNIIKDVLEFNYFISLDELENEKLFLKNVESKFNKTFIIRNSGQFLRSSFHNLREKSTKARRNFSIKKVKRVSSKNIFHNLN